MRDAHRYGVILALTVVILVFTIAAPDTDVTVGIGIALQGTMLLAVLATSSSPRMRRNGGPLAGFIAAAAVVTALGGLSSGVSHGLWALLTLLCVPEIVSGLGRLLRTQGVTPHAVMGGLTIYLLMGMVFALGHGAGAALSDKFWFAQGTDGTLGDRVYFSFAALTTTGFGDLSAGTPVGRAFTVVEMLTGQLYLVTVVGVLVAGVGRRAPGAQLRSRDDLDEHRPPD